MAYLFYEQYLINMLPWSWNHGVFREIRNTPSERDYSANIANALMRKPEIINKVGRCVVMGGAPCGRGNITPPAEYNFWIDPDAARVVMRSRLPIELIGLHLCHGEASLEARDIELLEKIPGELSRFAVACSSRARQVHIDRVGKDGLSLGDPIAVAVALDPSIASRWGEHR